MKKHEHPTNRLEKMSNFFGGGNFSKLNLYHQINIVNGETGALIGVIILASKS